MLQIRKAAITLDEQEMSELEEIMLDRDQEAALKFLRRSIYNKLIHAQRGKLASDLG